MSVVEGQCGVCVGRVCVALMFWRGVRMSLTTGQYNKIRNHPSLRWLKEKGDKSQAVPADTIQAKIIEALKSDSETKDRCTNENISWVSVQVGTPWGQFYVPVPFLEGDVHVNAVNEIERQWNPLLAQAVRMIFGGTAEGRTAPGSTGVNHIHVGGHGTLNILFDTGNKTILGLVHGHMDNEMSDVVKREATKVSKRKGGDSVQMRLQGNTIELC